MTPRRIIGIIVFAFLLFLGIYTWNQRTGFWDNLAANTGLEFIGVVLKSADSAQRSVVNVWEHYVALIDVRKENDLLRARVQELEYDKSQADEDRAELTRLRQLFGFDMPAKWTRQGARVLGTRMGPNAVLESLILSKGYLSGATPGTPAANHVGLVGRVLKAGPSTSVLLLLTDPGSRVAVVTSQGRVQGILAGNGPGRSMELRFVSQNARVNVGEVLVSSGLDSVYPKGIPVARVESVAPSGYSSFQLIMAQPLVDIGKLEEVLLLEHPIDWYAPEGSPVYQTTPTDSLDEFLSDGSNAEPNLNDPPNDVVGSGAGDSFRNLPLQIYPTGGVPRP